MSDEVIKFVCKHCRCTTKVKEEEARGYLNWKCKCGEIAPKEGFNSGNVIWKCDTGTVARNK